MKYTLITQKSGCHLIVDALLRSVEKYLNPDEILVTDARFKYYPGVGHGRQMNQQVKRSRNDYILMLDQDIMIFDNGLVEEMYRDVLQSNVYACGALDLPYQDGTILVASCNMLNKKLFLDNEYPFNNDSEPCIDSFAKAMRLGQKLIKVGKTYMTTSLTPQFFHLNQACQLTYSDLILNGWWKRWFNQWKEDSGSTENLEDYVVDDGMDYMDQYHLQNTIFHTIDYWSKKPFSLILLDDMDVEYLHRYYSDPGRLDPLDRKLAEELIEYVRDATWVGHSKLYMGCYDDAFDWKVTAPRYASLYEKIGVMFNFSDTSSGRYCLPIQNYMFFVKGFKENFYKLVSGRRVRYAGPYDAMGDLNKKIDLGLSKYDYYHLSGDHDSLEGFFDNFKVQDWDYVFVSGDLYSNIIVGRIKKMGGIAINIGESIFFNLDDTMKKALTLSEDGLSYQIKDGYKNYGKRLYEKYLIRIQE
jgi:glycosyltransferase involved in cell wall biosynthesis